MLLLNKDIEDWIEDEIEQLMARYEKAGTPIKGGKSIADSLRKAYNLGCKSSFHSSIIPYKTTDVLPTCVGVGEEECWWFDSITYAWYFGMPLFLDFSNQETCEQWAYWLPSEAICHPSEI